jgi:ABC-2 type transport system permease protein
MLQNWAPEPLIQTIGSFSFLTHFQSIIKGVIDLRDAVFFASVIGVFLLANVVLVDLKKAD